MKGARQGQTGRPLSGEADHQAPAATVHRAGEPGIQGSPRRPRVAALHTRQKDHPVRGEIHRARDRPAAEVLVHGRAYLDVGLAQEAEQSQHVAVVAAVAVRTLQGVVPHDQSGDLSREGKRGPIHSPAEGARPLEGPGQAPAAVRGLVAARKMPPGAGQFEGGAMADHLQALAAVVVQNAVLVAGPAALPFPAGDAGRRCQTEHSRDGAAPVSSHVRLALRRGGPEPMPPAGGTPYRHRADAASRCGPRPTGPPAREVSTPGTPAAGQRLTTPPAPAGAGDETGRERPAPHGARESRHPEPVPLYAPRGIAEWPVSVLG